MVMTVAGVPLLVVMVVALYVGVVVERARNVRHNSLVRITRNTSAKSYSLIGNSHLRSAADTTAYKRINTER